jgi:mannosyltransferase
VAAALIILAVGQQGGVGRLLIGTGLQYYLARDMRPGVPVPRTLLIARTAVQADGLYPVQCPHVAACLGHPSRIWLVGAGHPQSPYQAVTRYQAGLLRQHYRLSTVNRVPRLTVFLLTRLGR